MSTTGIDSAQIKAAQRHGTQADVQMSDGTGASGNLPKFNADGSLTDSGIAASGVGGGTWVDEAPSGTLNGTNKTFTLSHTPLANTCTVYLNGVEQDQTRWVSLSGSTLTFTAAPISIDFIRAIYQY